MHVGSATVPPQATMTGAPERAEGPGPDRDGDADDRTSVKSATTPGVGQKVDINA